MQHVKDLMKFHKVHQNAFYIVKQKKVVILKGLTPSSGIIDLTVVKDFLDRLQHRHSDSTHIQSRPAVGITQVPTMSLYYFFTSVQYYMTSISSIVYC